MNNSFKSWNDVNEGLFGTRSSQVYVAPNGHKFKVVIKFQNDKMFIVKTVNEMQLLDTNSKLTSNGATSLIGYLNSQQAFIKTFGKIDATFFATKFIIYTVAVDTPRTEKIQFTITDRSEVNGLDPKIQFVSTDALEAIKNKSDVLSGIITDNKEKASTDQIEGETVRAEDGKVSDGKGSDITKKSLGNRFRYTMRTNSITYVCEISENGSIEMEPWKGKGPIGAISWESPKVVWLTDADNSGTVNNEPLYMDGEITNKTDKEFFTKMFTDEAFKNKTIKEYEDEYGDSEMTGDNLKKMLYYRDNTTPIFVTSAASAKPAETNVSGTTGTSVTDHVIFGKNN